MSGAKEAKAVLVLWGHKNNILRRLLPVWEMVKNTHDDEKDGDDVLTMMMATTTTASSAHWPQASTSSSAEVSAVVSPTDVGAEGRSLLVTRRNRHRGPTYMYAIPSHRQWSVISYGPAHHFCCMLRVSTPFMSQLATVISSILKHIERQESPRDATVMG